MAPKTAAAKAKTEARAAAKKADDAKWARFDTALAIKKAEITEHIKRMHEKEQEDEQKEKKRKMDTAASSAAMDTASSSSVEEENPWRGLK